MSEFIGSRISLISKSDIRYVGTLHEINSENSTVALENVKSFGTEGRRNGDDEIPASDHLYEYIVFRGSDVKDLRIEEPAKETKPAPPQMPDDPAILGAQRPPQGPPGAPQNQQQQRSQQPPNFPQQGQFPPGYPPYGPPFGNQRFGPQGGFPGGPGGFGYPPPGPYGAPPGWYPPPGQGFNQPPGPFSPPMPIGPPGQNQNQQPPQGPKGAPTAPIGPPVNKDEKPRVAEADGTTKIAEAKATPQPPSQKTTPAPGAAAKQAPPPPVESKPDVAAALAPPPTQPSGAPKTAPAGPKSGRIVPAVPLPSPGMTKASVPQTSQPTASAPSAQATNASAQYQNATHAATAAVAAAMAKLAPAGAQRAPAQPKPQGDAVMDNLTRKVNEMRTDDQIRHGRQPGTGGFATGHRGGRGGRGRGGHHAAKMEVPTTDFDFESSNAKFNKQDLVKEAIASGSPLGGDVSSPPTTEAPTNSQTNGASSAPETAEKEVLIPQAMHYDRSTSFFDNISSELNDKQEAAARRGQEFRSEERRKNMETFGQGSVDNYRGGFRGRGRGRSFGRGRGRGFGGRGGGQRGGRGAQVVGEL